MNVPSPPLVASQPVPMALRILSGIGGLVVFLIGFIVSVGAIVVAPVGVGLVRRWARRRGIKPTRISSLVGGVLASVALATVLWSLLFALMPAPSPKELQSAATDARTRSPLKLPGWYARVFPQAAQADSATRQMAQSPAFMKMMFVMSGLFAGVFFGIVGGALGWCGSTLFRIAWSGSA